MLIIFRGFFFFFFFFGGGPANGPPLPMNNVPISIFHHIELRSAGETAESVSLGVVSYWNPCFWLVINWFVTDFCHLSLQKGFVKQVLDSQSSNYLVLSLILDLFPAKTCPSVPLPANGVVIRSASSCTASTVDIGTTCVLGCEEGFQLSSVVAVTRCMPDGTWLQRNGGELQCLGKWWGQTL